MSAAIINLTVEQGTTFSHVLQWFQPDGETPINLTGCTARSEWRATTDDTTVLVDLNTTNGKIVIDESEGTVTLHLSATETAAFTFTSCVHDIEIVWPEVDGEIPVYRLAKGKVKVSKEITRG